MKKTFNIRNITLIAILAATAALLTLFDFPLPFIAPSFYKLDFSEIPVLIGTFAMGPVAGALIELLKVLLNLLFNGTVTVFVGEASNLVMGLALVIPAGIIYKSVHTKKSALVSLIVGSIIYILAGTVLNAFVLLPAYSSAYGMPLDDIIHLGTMIHPNVNSIYMFVIYLVLPFNFIKAFANCTITMLIYKKISKLIKGFQALK